MTNQSTEVASVAEIPATPVAKPLMDIAQYKRDLSIDGADLDNAVRMQASMFGHYSIIAARARLKADGAKYQDEVNFSALYAEYRERLTAAGKVTEAQIDAAVKADPRWMDSKRALIEAQAVSNICNDSREAFGQRKDMLVQLTVDRRKEGEGEMRVRIAQAANGENREEALRVIAQNRQGAQA